jgi:hypothetical protein
MQKKKTIYVEKHVVGLLNKKSAKVKKIKKQ